MYPWSGVSSKPELPANGARFSAQKVSKAMSGSEDQGNELLLTYREVSRRYNLPPGTLYTLVREARIPHIRLGRRLVRFRRDDVEKWLADRTVSPRAPGREVVS